MSAEFSALFAAADAAGSAAVEDIKIDPMVVIGDGVRYVVADGPCGFAWVTVRPGNCKFARWLVRNGLARKAYGGGVSIWIHQYNQSMGKKEAYAHAFAKVIAAEGIECYAGSRMD